MSADAQVPNPFFTEWGLRPALDALDPKSSVKLASLFSGQQLSGLMPLAFRGDYYGYPLPHFSGWLHANAFDGTPLVRSGAAEDFWRALLDWCDANSGRALFLHIPLMDRDGPVFAGLKAVTADQGRAAAIVQEEDRASLNTELGSEAYYEESLSTKKRKELRRQHRRLAEVGELSFARETGEETLDDWIAAFLALEAAGWKGENGSSLAAAPATDTIFRETLTGAARAGALERLSLTLDGKPIAMLANFIVPPGAFSYKTAFDEEYARFSPGVLLQRENLALLDRADIAWTDSCAAPDHPMIDRIWRERRRMVRVSVAIGGKARRLLCRQILRRETGEDLKGL
ncbi:GNAT family N-acetyltransferase [Qipengyuania sp. JC766]|uniref:GNAT family N-acetyltransferase n=1 Tax=Qipengyuania sp. JC766 TaxID=3232139 RepID=UPI003457BE61